MGATTAKISLLQPRRTHRKRSTTLSDFAFDCAKHQHVFSRLQNWYSKDAIRLKFSTSFHKSQGSHGLGELLRNPTIENGYTAKLSTQNFFSPRLKLNVGNLGVVSKAVTLFYLKLVLNRATLTEL